MDNCLLFYYRIDERREDCMQFGLFIRLMPPISVPNYFKTSKTKMIYKFVELTCGDCISFLC